MLTPSLPAQIAQHVYAYDLECTRRAWLMNQQEAAHAYGLPQRKYARMVAQNANITDTGILMLYALYNDDWMAYGTADLPVVAKTVLDATDDERQRMFASIYGGWFHLDDACEYSQWLFGSLFNILKQDVESYLTGGAGPPAWLLIFMSVLPTMHSREAALECAVTAVEKTFGREQCISPCHLLELHTLMVRRADAHLRIQPKEHAQVG